MIPSLGAISCGQSSKKSTFEKQQDALDCARHLAEYGRNRLSFESLQLGRRYIDGKTNLALKFTLQLHQYEAIFQRVPASGSGWVNAHCAKYGVLDQKTVYAGGHSDYAEVSVLVSAVHFVKAEKQVIPSLVWIYRSDDVGEVRREALYFELLDLMFQRFLAVPDREHEAVFRNAMPDSDLADGIVENSLKVLSRDSDHPHELFRDVGRRHDLVDFISGLTLSIDDELVGIGGLEAVDRGFEITNLAFGPF